MKQPPRIHPGIAGGIPSTQAYQLADHGAPSGHGAVVGGVSGSGSISQGRSVAVTLAQGLTEVRGVLVREHGASLREVAMHPS